MIYTVTLNPSFDLKMNVDALKLGHTNIASHASFEVGGKGINVAMLLKALGHEVTCMGFLAGFLGKQIEEELLNQGINTDFVYLNKGSTRINVKLKDQEETEINNLGPFISKTKKTEFLRKFKKIQAGDVLILSGSAALNLDEMIYAEILKEVKDGVFVVVDARQKYLLNTLAYKPDLIKPNKMEAEELANQTIHSFEDCQNVGQYLRDLGAKRVIISLGEDGAFLQNEEGSYYRNAKKCEAKFTTGAGDSLVAGFVHAHLLNKEDSLALHEGLRCAYETVLYGKIKKKK